MPHQILVIHGGDAYDTYEEYLAGLKQKEIELERLRQTDWKSSLQEDLGKNFEVIAPRMPCAQNAKYSEWTLWFEKIIPLLNDSIILIGHSLGGIFLAKYLSENSLAKNITAAFLIAAPYNTAQEHPLADFILPADLSNFSRQSPRIFLYHSRDDEVVPFSNFESYARALPKAEKRIFEDRQHFNQPKLPEITQDIKTASTNLQKQP